MWCSKLILISCLGVVSCRPQSPKSSESGEKPELSVDIEKQLLYEVSPTTEQHKLPSMHHRMIEASTRDILEKIAEVNKKQGLTPTKAKPNYFHFPFSYSRSQARDQRFDNFKFPKDPFTNPIFEYIEKENKNNQKEDIPRFRTPNLESSESPEGYAESMPDPNTQITEEDIVPGQYITRKITHYQSVLVPNPYMPMPNVYNMGNMPGYLNPSQPGNMYPHQPHNMPTVQIEPNSNKNLSSMEKQTIENIKSIVQNNENFQSPAYSNPYFQNQQIEYSVPPNYKARQNWNWPGANMFPIYIRDPFLQMYYAVTNMIEYGPTAGNEGPCKLTPRPQGSRIKVKPKTVPHVSGNSQRATITYNKKKGMDEIRVFDIDDTEANDDVKYLDVEDIDIGNDDELVKFVINMPKVSGEREAKGDGKTLKSTWYNYSLKSTNDTYLDRTINPILIQHKLELPETKQSPTIRDQIIHADELEEEQQEAEKAEDISISNQGTRKVFSKDNTGNGIFIHKLKVRQGGVAIAGPGGIATAGSGGTAIVGPNGVAYTHPDGLAIAGSGTKVVAVDPKIDLNDVINHSVANGTRLPPSRIGKVVAVGPVVYYNRG